MSDMHNPHWLEAWSAGMTTAQAAADLPMIAIALDGDIVHTQHLGATAGDAEAAALAILIDLLNHYNAAPDDQICENCRSRIVRLESAVAALTDGETAPVLAADRGTRLQ